MGVGLGQGLGRCVINASMSPLTKYREPPNRHRHLAFCSLSFHRFLTGPLEKICRYPCLCSEIPYPQPRAIANRWIFCRAVTNAIGR